eukprot:TRINITY_DN22891_c0_g1_i1.p1 TRINITY_DN22891_c0_g1~~TRINITY_DN22891_c0_g1_i1.p1  ORF type:complete len:501 (+),score=103.78 TRINITY_DN22891_c0_g1_i1:105-1607(+)
MRWLFAVGLAAGAAGASPIKHVVVLYEENRAFDHLLGWARTQLGVDGLFGNETNPVNCTDPSKGTVQVTADAPYVAVFDPQHSMPAYNHKIFCGGTNYTVPNEKMTGYYEWESGRHGDKAGFVMAGFSPERLPVTMTLAEEFAVFDRWYSAHAGPSTPNHLFTLTGTSAGTTETGTGYNCKGHSSLFPQKTIFESLAEGNQTWKMIYNDSRGEMQLSFLNTAEAAKNTHNMDEFFYDAAHGTLPAFTFITPRQGINKTLGNLGGPNSDHPSCCDIALGERLRKDIYEALRAGPGWNSTAFIMTWDDGGGFFDHVHPPRAPPPDNYTSCPDKFKFDRLGSRLPVVVVSPWISKGTVVHEPEGPEPDSQYDSTSIIATVKNIFGLPSFLTRRDAWAGSFDKLFEQRQQPRTDAPLHLPSAPPPKPRPGGHPWGTDCDDPTRTMRRSIKYTEAVLGVTAPPRLHRCAHTEPYWLHKCEPGTMQEASEWLAQMTARWKADRLDQ